MIPTELVDTINEVRGAYLGALDGLGEIESFSALRCGSPALGAAVEDAARPAASPHLARPCDGRLTVAVIGSSGHGKTTILDEMFPRLSQRGWLVTDVTDTTAQSLRIEYAPDGASDLEEVEVRSWGLQEIKDLMHRPEVAEQNRRCNIRVSYQEDGVEVDGREAEFPPEDRAHFRFPPTVRLRPFPEPFKVPADKARDRRFIRALTIKETSGVGETGPVLRWGEQDYNALQLRAVVKEVGLKDPFDRILRWSGRPAEEVGRLSFVDTPGLAVQGSVKDEVLRHFLENKSNQVALNLWRNDELDIVVHLVLCGRQSDFAVLWKAIERECGPAEMEGLAQRLVLAVNGTNTYFTNRDLRAKWSDAETARREGDHLAATLEDNILQKMSPRGRVRPARTCFLDSKSIVETLTTTSYAEAYGKFRPVMEEWTKPGGVGHRTLSELGLLDTFKENIEALADPEDRGQGFLVRQIQGLVAEQGAGLLLRKHLLRTGLLRAVADLREVLQAYYDADGRMNRDAIRDALRSCLGFLDERDLAGLERFAAEVLDPRIEEIVRTDGRAGPGWAKEAFHRLCAIVKEHVRERSEAPPDLQAEFARHFDAQARQWCEAWGYTTADLEPPDRGFANTAVLVTHCLKIHAREILYRLLVDELLAEGQGGFEQSREDQERMAALLRNLERAQRLGAAACAEHGVTA